MRVRGFGRGAAATARIWARLQELAAERELPLIVSAFRYCPLAMRGVSTLSHEILADLGEPPSACFVPVGGGGLFCAVAMGFEDHGGGVRMEPVQPLTNDTVVTALRTGGQAATAVVDGPGCGISGLSVPIDIDGAAVLRHARASGGRGFLVDEERVRALQERLYREEGIGVEPASAVALAGVEQALHEGRLDPDALVVALLTGHGFKEPQREAAIAAPVPVREVGEEELAAALTAAT
ncbi:MAG: PLP-dependent lyase/thiolase [Armatimonadetes bacterium]|nr:PLP-dependent lyase/thiolase [Armatimonadota bacterium]